jgi:hypothetical protein
VSKAVNLKTLKMESTYLAPTSILRLFETTKSERGSFVTQVIERLENGDVDPLETHLQVKSMEDLIKQITDSKEYKKLLLDAASKHGKSFEYHSAKFETKEVGSKYDFSNCGDPIHDELEQKAKSAADALKERQYFLKTLPVKGLEILINDELITIYPPSKTSTTAIAVTLK